MTDTRPDPTPPAPPTAPVPTPPTPSARGLKIALAISVALNLAVAGMVAGAWLKDGPSRGMPRDLSFGPFSEALSLEDRRALRKSLIDRAPGFRETRQAAQAEFAALLDALRASPFDPGAVQSALAAIEARNAGRLELGRGLIEARIAQMSDADRLAFADRLEKGLRRTKRD
ncbi:periplasmic heavy metal sensor [Tabrizicola sp.]|uniref:periplasmic heavy metal sensor n=1 Tax=Tabrizicola sp. TaxID=2005166 RepID=UPI0026106971|nr:periplasmic heavy metal sensor [Tabrizicola sp.]MDM7933394.1 periplasmic heavy metal sensor [Tabrizicola sp.]